VVNVNLRNNTLAYYSLPTKLSYNPKVQFPYLFIMFSSSIVNGALNLAGLAFFEGIYPKQ
jgi:hypothetical protein